MKLNKKLVLIELNEINFDYVQRYIDENPKKYQNLNKIINLNSAKTYSEKNYEEIEPWIQWVSVHTGLTFNEHRIFRLGDIVGSKIKQIFELIEDNGYSVGVICALNVENRLKNPAYFIPDPWTKTCAGSSFYQRKIAQSISQLVNDNAQGKIKIVSAITILITAIFNISYKYYYIIFNYIIKKAKCKKVFLLEILLHNMHLKLLSKRSPNFSTIFFNGGAHIQHHYMFNSKPNKKVIKHNNPRWYISEDEDPLAEMLLVYDKIIGDYLSLENTEIIVATGLSQKPYDRNKIYYRLKNHENFMSILGIEYKNVMPLMSRDFIINFSTEIDLNNAKQILENIRIKNTNIVLFGVIEKRNLSLFITLTYPDEINEETIIENGKNDIKIYYHIILVAIKNGMHVNNGYLFFSDGIRYPDKEKYFHVKMINNMILNYFNS